MVLDTEAGPVVVYRADELPAGVLAVFSMHEEAILEAFQGVDVDAEPVGFSAVIPAERF